MKLSSMQTDPFGERFAEALSYATQLHQGQQRKVTGVPYICHLLSVAGLVIEDGGCEDSAIAALLHDTVEDQGGLATLKVIRQRFGTQVAAWVWDCTARPLHMPAANSSKEWRSRKQTYFEQIQAAAPQAKRIVLADKLHNGRSLLANLATVGSDAWNKFSGDKEDILWFYKSCSELFSNYGWMAKQLAKVTKELSTYPRS